MNDLILKYLRALYVASDKPLVPEQAIPPEWQPLYFAIAEGLSPDQMALRGLSIPEVELYHDAGFYADEVRNTFKSVKLIELATKILEEGTLDPKLLEEIESLDAKSSKLNSMITSTMDSIHKKSIGEEYPFLETGYTEMDRLTSLDMKQIVLFAAEKKLGKTKFIIQLMVRIYDRYKIPIKFIALEPSYQEIIRTILAIKSNIPEQAILSRGVSLTREQIGQLDIISTDYLGRMDLQIIDDARSLHEIKSVLRRFKGIIIIDNLGLIGVDAYNETEAGNKTAKALVQLRDTTGSLIFVLHHLTKQAAVEENLQNGYHPRLDYVRGTGRILDYANQVWLGHRPAFYRDYMLQAAKTLSPEEMLKVRKLFMVDVALNRGGDTGLVRTYCDLATSRFIDPWTKK